MPRCAAILLCSTLLIGCSGGEKIIKSTNPVTIEKPEKSEKTADKHGKLPPIPAAPKGTGPSIPTSGKKQ